MESEELRVVETMEELGGSFVKALAKCFRFADPMNFIRLQVAFPEYWAQYEKLSQHEVAPHQT